MKQKILIIGAGFAGLWSALAAVRRLELEGAREAVDVVVVSPEPVLTIRPRLYEANPEAMVAPLGKLFEDAHILYIQGNVTEIRTHSHEVDLLGRNDELSTIKYDRLILAAGSQLYRPDVPGLTAFGFSADRLEDSGKLDAHLHALRKQPQSLARDTVIVAGGGFTGIEMAAELPARLRDILGADSTPRVIVVERAEVIGPELGAGPRPVINQALGELGVEYRLGSAVIEINARGLATSSGEHIESMTVIWAAGMRATLLTAHIPGDHDALGRVRVDRNLEAPGAPNVFVTGDAAVAATDDEGHQTMMSCQHAMLLGRSSGDNAVADLLGKPLRPYSQPGYVTCLDLGPWGAVVTRGWDRQIWLTGAEAKVMKGQINGVLIYPPADLAVALASADPAIDFRL